MFIKINYWEKLTASKLWFSEFKIFLFFESSNSLISTHKNCEWKVKLWWVGACERKNRVFFVLFVLSEGNVLKLVFYLSI